MEIADKPSPVKAPISGLRLAGWSAVLSSVLAFARAPLTGEVDLPASSAAPQAIYDFFAGLTFNSAFVGGVTAAAISWLLIVVFVAIMADLTRVTGDSHRWVAYLMIGGSVVYSGLNFGYISNVIAGAASASEGMLNPEIAGILFRLIWTFIYMASVAWALVAIPLGYAILKTSILPRWLGWSILVILVANVAANFMPYEISSITGALPYLWTLAAGIVLLLQASRHKAPGIT